MADQKITALTELAEADVASSDVLPIADVSASETKKVTVKSLVEQGVDLIDDASIPAAKLASISPSSLGSSSGAKEFIAGPTDAGGAYTSRTIASTDLPAATASDLGGAAAGTGLTSTSGTFSVDPATTTTRGAISVPSASGLNVDGSGVISHQSSVTGQTKNGFTINAQGHITAVGSIAPGDLPKATTSAVGGVFVGSGLSVTASGQINHTDSITAGTTSGITFNDTGHITATTALTGSDLPTSTTTAKGAVSIPSGALSVSGAGALTHDTSGITAGTYPKVTVDARGHITAGTTLSASDIPDISAAKLTSGTIGTSLIANDAITGAKLADQSTVRFAGAPDTAGVVNFGTANFTGEFLYDEFHDDLYIWTGNSFKAIDIVSGEIVLAGTYDASTNLVASVTPKGTAIGLTVGQPLISPAASNSNHYLTVSQSGTGSGNAPAVALAPPDFLLSTGTSWQVLDLSAALAATNANNVAFSPTGNVSASNVQAAIEELDTEKASLTGPTFTGTTTFSGNVLLGTSATLTFEGSSADDHETSFTFTNPTADRSINFGDVSGTVLTTGDTGTVTNTMLAGSIALSKLVSLTSGQLIVGNTSNVAAAVAVSGDVTLASTGAITINDDAVTAAKLADTSVTAGSYTAADITVDAQGRITSAASGTIGTAEIADDAITADKLADTAVTAGSYTAADITVDAQGRVTAAASGTIGTSEIADDAVTADKLADTAVTAGSYTAADITVDAQGRVTSASNGSVGTGEIADAAITTAKIADDAVTAAKLANTAVTAGSYTAADITVDAQGRITSAASGTIGTSEIADDAVTADKLADTSVTAGSYTFSSITVDAQGRITAASSGTQADTDKISEGNTEAEVVDTGSDGHFKVTTENTERIRVGPAGQIGIAGANYGTSGQVLTSGGASGAISWGDVSTSPTFQGTADGALTDGMPVIITSSGNVKSAARVVTEHTPSVTSAEADFESGQTRNISTAYMTDQNVHFVAYCDQDDSNRGKIIPITINSNTSMSFGADVTFETTAINSTELVYDPVNDIVGVAYTKSNGDLQFKIGKLTGTQGGGSESFNNLDGLQVDSGVSDKVKMFAHPDGGFVVFYTKSNTIKTEVVTVTNGDTLTGGTADEHIAMGHDANFSVSYDGNDNYVIWWGQGSSAPGKARAARHTGTGTSRRVVLDGSTTQFEADTIMISSTNQAAYDAKADRHVFSYRNQDDSEDLYVIACDRASDGGLTFGTAVEYETNPNENAKAYYDTFAEKVFLVVAASHANALEYRKLTISGSTITVGGATSIRGQESLHYDLAFSTTAQRWLLAAKPSSSGSQGAASAVQIATAASQLTTENYIGISNGAYSNGATATVQIVGSVDDAQSGLTPGQSYFVQDDGSLGLTADATVGSVFAGTAVSATKLIVKG